MSKSDKKRLSLVLVVLTLAGGLLCFAALRSLRSFKASPRASSSSWGSSLAGLQRGRKPAAAATEGSEAAYVDRVGLKTFPHANSSQERSDSSLAGLQRERKPTPAAIGGTEGSEADIDRVGYLELNTSCLRPPSEFRAWRDGVVTPLTPVIQRNCSKLFAGNHEETARVKEKMASWKNPVSDEELLKNSSDCAWVRQYFNNNLYITKLEKSFPIAFSFLIHNSLQQVVRLLRFLYRPHNTYCIHADKKSSSSYKQTFHNLASCLGNIVIPETEISVRWGHHSIMDAQMLCLKELVSRRESQPEPAKWKYVINLCGKEFPLATTHEIVSKLTKLNGSASFMTARTDKNRVSNWRLKGKTIPHNFVYYKSMTYGAISYTFAHFLLTNDTAQELYKFFQGCDMPEEHFYATLYRVPGVPGGYDPKLQPLYFHIDFYIWLTGSKRHCGGKNVHAICVVSVDELQEIVRRTEDGHAYVFHNKYFMGVDHVVMDCAEEKMVTRNKLEYKQECLSTT